MILSFKSLIIKSKPKISKSYSNNDNLSQSNVPISVANVNLKLMESLVFVQIYFLYLRYQYDII